MGVLSQSKCESIVLDEFFFKLYQILYYKQQRMNLITSMLCVIFYA